MMYSFPSRPASMAFGEVFKTTDNIKAILDAYPFSVGIFREILQNSDDARATKQIFLLDRRQHPNEKIYHPSLAGTQGPALLAYNDKELSESDWNALQTVHSSSKKHDSSKIGKYGIGFRSCYHVTDNPQVMSGSDMAVFDPHRRLTAGGCRFSMRQHKYDYAHHIDSFGALLPMEFPQYLSGTIFRLPLRTRSDSEISSKIIHADDVLDLLEAFWEEELDIVLLFLRNILTIEIIVIEENGQQTSRAKCSISRTPLSPSRYSLNPDIYSFNTCQVTTVTSAGESQLSWVILHTAHDSEGAEAHLSVTSKADVAAALRDHKLSPEMALAIPVPLSVGHRNVGRLFTFLPLPLSTGFPVHVHGLFSLTQSRQNLRNNGEVGIAEGSSDSVLIKWNEMMFNVFLPKVWAVLLYAISQDIQSSSIDIFLGWPQPQPAVESGDSTNWKDILGKLSTEVVEQEYPIWPCEDANGAVTFLTLTDVLLAPKDSEHPCHRILSILTSAGVKVSKVPAYIIGLFQERGQGDILVSPTRLSRFFQEYPAMLENVPYDDRLSLLDYILSTKELRLLNNLSIVPLPNREFAKLSLRTKMKARATNRILLDAPESNLFQRFDEGAVLLSCLPHKIAKLLKKDGPSILNVKLIDNDSVLRYLESFPGPLALDERASWLKNFWLWLSKDWSDRASLIGTIGDLCLLPSQLGERTVSGGVFYDDTTRMTRQKHVSTLVAILGKLRVPLLPSDFPEEARDYLSRQAVVKSIRNISALLEVMDTKANLSNEEAEAILNHFLKYRTSLTDADRQLARRMPIFPLLSYIADKVQVVLGRIPDRARVEGIEDVTAVVEHSLLPCISDYTFVDSSSPNRDALQILIPSQRPLSSIDLLNLSLKGFGTQPVSFQCRTLKFVAQKVTQIPPSIIETLKVTPFLPASNGDLRAPQDVVDPSSAIAKLFSTDTEKLPSAATDAELVMIIGRLGLFQNELTTPLVNERIRYITSSSSKESHKLAQTLLELLETSHFDCANVEVPTGKRKGWLPTKEGLKPHDECLDPKFYQRALFDEVLAMVNGVSLSLRRRFGWGDHVRISVVVQQFKRVVETENKEKLKIVIKELAERLDELDARQIEELRRTIEGRAWIPTTRGIFPSSRVVFSIPNGRDIPGFHRLADAPDSPRGIFYLKMGCTKSPSTHAILSRLNEIRNQASSKRTSEEALFLLQALPLPLPDTDVEDLLIPDAKNMLRPVKEMVYSDVKNGSGSLAGRHLTHPSIDHNLAKNLGISFLGHERLHIENLAVSDFEEKLTTKISSTLTQYTLKQLLPELLANAIDAGAKNFGILVDEQPAPTERLLSPTMERFQICPSLIIHNDGVFSDTDWKGICNIGVGGKLNKTDTIGQYGLGALSMFHLTDMPMVVSGNKVLFLDPSKTHLPSKTPTAAYLLSLPELAREYPDHLSVLDEIFEFDVETEYYDATLFRLPLRRAQDGDSFISNKPLNTAQLLDDLVVPFRKRAQESLLFTPITSITAFHRPTGEGNLTRALWRVDVSRQIRSEEGDYTSQRLEMRSSAEKEKEYRQTWHIVRGENLSPLPPECESLPVTHRIRSPFIVGAAAQLPSGSKKGRKPTAVIAPEVSTLFSTLPLPLGTYLPFELSAPFILSSDRRNIRFESSYEKTETAYNRWLLLEHIPPLYFFLLEELLQDGYDISPCWPGRTAKHDPISETVIKSFYEKLPSTTRRLFMAGTMHLTPGEITSSGNEPPVVFQILTQLGTPNMVQLSPSLSKRFEGAIKQVDQGLLRNEILRNHDGFISWYRKAKKRTEKINILITFLLKGDSPVDILNDLPLLPLADGGLFAFQNGPNSTVIYSSYKQKLLKLLPVTRLVDPKFRSLAPTLHDKGLNIAPLKPEAVKELLQGIIPEGPLRRVSQKDHEQIGRFWELSSHLPEPLEDTFLQLSSLCLLPTSAPLVYISLSHSKEPSVLFTARGDEDWLLPCLTAFRATVVHWTNLERIPRGCLEEKEDTFLGLLSHISTTGLRGVPQKFGELDDETKEKFAGWCSQRLQTCDLEAKEDIMRIVPSLPIWQVYRPNQVSVFDTVEHVPMLPIRYSSGALLKFIRKHLSHPVTPYSFELREMGIQPMSLRAIQDSMVLPTILPETDMLSYKSLIEALLLDSGHTHIGDIDLPNEDRTMTRCSSLYAFEPLFRAAFSQARFLNNSFRTLEPNLRRHGLKSLDSLDMNMFKEVAEAFHNEEINNDPNRIANARTIAQVYYDLLPVRVGRAANWRSLERLRFIPAINEPERRGNGRTNSSLLDYVRRFPSIVAPNEVILEGYVAIAWTQRAILPTRPESIIIANPDFGVPTAQEIIRHLRALARYTAQNPKAQRRRVLNDLKATYRWLEEHHNEAQELSTHRDEQLFLNIDDPDDLGSWSGKWIAADDLFFNIQDTGRSRGVRTFLKKFPNLLRVAGVAEVHDPVVPTANVSSVETLFNKQQALFERMRQEGQFLDVKFVEKDTNKEAWAHRVVLSTASDYFWSCFCASGLQECRTASKDDPVIVTMEEHTIESVNMVLDYIYTRSVPTVARSEQMDVDENFEGTELGRLLDAVRLAGYWQIEDLFEILQAAMIREKMITPYTVDSIFTVASQHGAHHLVKACEQFRNANQSVIEKIERRLS